MVSGMRFGSLRLIIIALALLAQIYLFLRIRRAIRSSGVFGRFTSPAVALAGAAIGALFALNWMLLSRAAPWVDPPAALRVLFFYAPAVWVLGSMFSAVLLFLSQVLGWMVRGIAHVGRRSANPGRHASVGISRRTFLRAGVAGAGAAPFLLSAYGAGRQDHEIREVVLRFGVPLLGVQLTDIHAGVFMTRESMRRCVDRIIGLKPEIFLLTGDYISNSRVFFPGFVEEMARVRSRYGTFATLGNHEHWYGEPDYYEALFRQHGIRLLQNSHNVIVTDQGRFAVAGIDDLRSGRPDLKAALDGLDPSTPTILLSHRPEIFPRTAALGISLTLAGHYHGGQVKVRLPGGDLSLAHLRTPYPEGLYRVNSSRLYVSRGIGTTFTPVRLNVRPEVTLLRLT